MHKFNIVLHKDNHSVEFLLLTAMYWGFWRHSSVWLCLPFFHFLLSLFLQIMQTFILNRLPRWITSVKCRTITYIIIVRSFRNTLEPNVAKITFFFKAMGFSDWSYSLNLNIDIQLFFIHKIYWKWLFMISFICFSKMFKPLFTYMYIKDDYLSTCLRASTFILFLVSLSTMFCLSDFS